MKSSLVSSVTLALSVIFAVNLKEKSRQKGGEVGPRRNLEGLEHGSKTCHFGNSYVFILDAVKRNLLRYSFSFVVFCLWCLLMHWGYVMHADPAFFGYILGVVLDIHARSITCACIFIDIILLSYHFAKLIGSYF